MLATLRTNGEGQTWTRDAAASLREQGNENPRGLGSAAAVDEETRPYPFLKGRASLPPDDSHALWAGVATGRPRLTNAGPAEVRSPAPELAPIIEARDDLTPARSTVRGAAFSLASSARMGGAASPHWYVRLRLKQDHLAELWTRNLTPRDVLVWHGATGYWTPLLDVPELRAAIDAASDGGLRELGESIARRPAPRSQRPPPPSARPRTPGGTPGYSSIPPAVVHAPVPSIPRPPRVASVQLAAPTTAPPARTPSAPPPRASASQTPPRRATWIDGRAEHLTWLAAGLLAGIAIAIGAGRLSARHHVDPAAIGSATAAPVAAAPAHSSAASADGRAASASAREGTPVLAASALPMVSAPTQTLTAPRRHTREAGARSESSGATTPGSFDRKAARSALTSAALRSWHCGAGEAFGTVVMTFSPSGAAQSVAVNGLDGDMRKACVAAAFRSTRIKPFRGGPVTVQKSFRLP